jgi:hypothetical protein
MGKNPIFAAVKQTATTEVRLSDRAVLKMGVQILIWLNKQSHHRSKTPFSNGVNFKMSNQPIYRHSFSFFS